MRTDTMGHADDRDDRNRAKAYIVGGGIASMAAAAFLIRDGHFIGKNITILEQLDKLGGSLDGAGSPETGYVVRGGRMMESKYQCTYGLFSFVPTLDKTKTVTQEIFEWNEIIKTGSKSRLVRDGRRLDRPDFGLREGHILTLERLVAEPESLLGVSSIEDQFDASFFATNFWIMWCTTFAFQPWHSAVEFRRYLIRFIHMIEGFNELKGIMRTVYNQYDSLVRPLKAWLEERDVAFSFGALVTDLRTTEENNRKRVTDILLDRDGFSDSIHVGRDDYVIVTLGSMTDASSLGSNLTPAKLREQKEGNAWNLWAKIAQGRPEFGRPATFADHIDESKWISFTATLKDQTFFSMVRDFTGNVPGEGGLITFADSNWLLSIVLPAQPHFIGQPADVDVFWGYGLFVDRLGNFVKKPMADCTGSELMQEVLGHLKIGPEAAHILDKSITIPCMMPFITSQFLRRGEGDRPEVVPAGWQNLGFVGQFVELPEDVVFTVEYSVRSAQAAVAELLDLKSGPPPVYHGEFHPSILLRALSTLHDFHF